MWKFEVTREGGAKELHMMEQSIDSDIARFIPDITNAAREDIRVFFLEKKAFLEGKKLLADTETYKVEHAANGDCLIKLVEDDSLVLTVVAKEFQWSEIYEVNDNQEEIYLLTEESLEEE